MSPAPPTAADGREQWDLRTRPDARDVEMEPGKDTVFYETRDPRPVEILLPEDHDLRLEATLVAFDRISVDRSEDEQALTGMDVRSAVLPLDEAYVLMRRSLTAFGMSTRPVEEWRRRIEERPTSGPSSSQRIEGGGGTRLGYLNVGVGGVFNPVNENDTAIIKYRVNFDPS